MNPIKALFERYVKEDVLGYYTPRKILPHFDDAMLMMIIGARRIGKTDLFLRLACDLWSEYRLKTMWVRNKLTELKKNILKIEMLEDSYDYSEAHPYYMRSSYGRKRDSRGRYSSAADDLIRQLEDMSDSAPDEYSRKKIHELIREMKHA